MKFSKTITFDATPEKVLEILTDPRFREEVALRAGADSAEITVEEQPDGRVRASVDTVNDGAQLSGIAKKVLGNQFKIHQEERWTSDEQADLVVAVHGTPGKVRGTVTLRAVGDATEQIVDADIKVPIPIVGGKAEQIIASILGRVLKLQGTVGSEWLSR